MFVLNKVDLVPTWVTQKWVALLSQVNWFKYKWVALLSQVNWVTYKWVHFYHR